MPSTVVMLNLNETRRDPRVRRIASSIASAGHRVVVIGPSHEASERFERIERFELMRVEKVRSTTSKDMAELDRACPEAAAIVRACDPGVMHFKLMRARRFAFRAQRRLKRELARVRDRRWAAPLRTLDPLLARAEASFSGYPAIHAIRSVLLTNLRLYEAALLLRPSVVHANDLNTLLAGFMLKSKLKIPLVYDAHEIFTEQLDPADRDPLAHRFYTDFERALLPSTDGRMTVCDSLGEYFERERGSRAFQTIRNVPSIALLPNESILERKNAPRRVLYHGNYYKHRGLDEIIGAAKHVPEARFIFRGFGAHEQTLRALAETERVSDRVRFEEPVAVTELVRTAAECDVGLCPFVDTSLNTRYALPNKFFEYTMAGLALAISDLIEMRRLLDAEKLGIVFRSLEPEVLGADIRKLVLDPERLDEHRRNAYRAAKETFNWETEQKRLFEYYRPFVR